MKRWLLVLVLIVAVGAVIAWRVVGKMNDAKQQAQARQAAAKAAPPVMVAPVASRDIVQTFISVGSAVAPFNVRIAPKVSGRLDYLTVREGARVRTGEVLARIDPSQIQAQISQQEANIAEAQQRLAQAQLTQNPTNVSVSTQIEQQAAALTSAKADENQVRQNYNAQVAAAQAAVTDAQGRIDSAAATIDNAQANIRSAQSNVNNAQVRYNRTYDLYKQGFVAAQDVDDAKTVLAVQNEALDVARGQLTSAQAARDSALAQKNSAQQQASIVAVKGKADIAAAVAKTDQARSALKYARSNTAQRPAYEQNLAALRSAVTAAQAQLRNLQSQLSDTILTSPITGFVTTRYVDPGSIVSPSQPVVVVQAIQDVFVDVSVPEDVAGHLHVGQDATIVFDALPGTTFTGHISHMSPAADPQSRQFPIRITLPNPGNLVKPGIFARVSLVTQRVPNALVVPREAVQYGKGGPTVVIVDSSGVAHRQPVQVGVQDPTGVQIREGVRAHDLVVTLFSQPVRDGQKVKPVAVAGSATGPNPTDTMGGGSSPRSAQSGGGGGAATGAGTAAGGPAGGAGGGASSTAAGAPTGSAAGASFGPGASSTSTGSGFGTPTSPSPGTTPPNTSAPANVPNTPPQIAPPSPTSVPGGAAPGRGSGPVSTGAPSGGAGASSTSGGQGAAGTAPGAPGAAGAGSGGSPGSGGSGR